MLRQWWQCLLVICLLSTTTYVSAQNNPSSSSQYTGLDILFIIDQSGSMGGTPYGGPSQHGNGRDPLGLRFLGPDFALRWINTYVNRDDTVDVRMSILTFGTTTRLLLDWTPIEPKQTNWNQTLSDLRYDISEERFGNVNLGFTDFVRAFIAGREMIEDAPLTNPNDQRLTAIVLLTDGSPCVPNYSTPTNCAEVTQAQEEAHLNRLAQNLNAYLPNTRVYIIALDATNAYFSRLQNSWETVACHSASQACDLDIQIAQVTNNAGIGQQFNLILADLMAQLSSTNTSTQVVNADGSFYVPPYSQVVNFNVFKNSSAPIANVQFLNPDNQVEPNVGVLDVNTPIQLYEINLPEPGTWRADFSQADPSTITGSKFTRDAILAVPNVELDNPSAIMYEPLNMTVEILDTHSNQSLPIYRDAAGNERYPLTVELLFYDGVPLRPQDRTLQFKAPISRDVINHPDANIFLSNFRPQESGLFDVRVNASYIDDQGVQQFLLLDETVLDDLIIEEAYIDWHGVSPSTQREGGEVSIRADFIEKTSGQALSNLGLVALEVSIRDLQGVVIGDPQIIPSGQLNAATIEGQLQLPVAGDYTVSATAGYINENDTFVSMGTSSPAYSLEVRPVHDIIMQFNLPQTTPSIVQEPFPRFWTNTPLRLQVLVNDEQGMPIDLANITGGVETAPQLTVTRNGEAYPDVPPLVPLGTGLYTVDLAGLPGGDYNFTASLNTPINDLLGDYNYATPTIELAHERTWADYVVPLVISLISAVLLLLALIAYIAYRRLYHQQTLAQNPMTGHLNIGIYNDVLGQYEAVWSRDLSDYNVNRYAFRRHELGSLPFRRLEITNHGSGVHNSDNTVFITQLLTDNEELAKGDIIIPAYSWSELPPIEVNGQLRRYAVGINVGRSDFEAAEF